MTRIERLIERALERDRNGALRAFQPRFRRSGHSEAIYWDHLGISVRLAEHPRTALGGECGHDEPDLDIVIGDATAWDIGRLGRYRPPTVWLKGYSRADFRTAIAHMLVVARRNCAI